MRGTLSAGTMTEPIIEADAGSSLLKEIRDANMLPTLLLIFLGVAVALP